MSARFDASFNSGFDARIDASIGAGAEPSTKFGIWPDPAEFAVLNTALAAILAVEEALREDALARWCAAQPLLAPALQRLFAASQTEFPALTTALQQSLNAVLRPPDQSTERLGDWRLLELLGRGGMAEVWLAQGEGAHRDQRAAVKRLALGLNTPELLARFAREREILASLDEPRIARLIDGGVSADHRPWLAMEFVDGQRIDAWCDSKRLDVSARVRLLREVAIAVHAAHQALVVHRDVKPANILVNANAQIKLLDFGIAKLLFDPAGSEPSATLPNAQALTPQYAAPEQFTGGPISTATDVYQLGVLCAELLSGLRPFQLRGESFAELAHAAVNMDAPAPSAALLCASKPMKLRAQIAAARQCSVPQLVRTLRGDLDAIVQAAMAREPAQRYSSAQALADDLGAWLAQMPVQARAPSFFERTRRQMRRNPWGSAGVLVLLLVLIAYAYTSQLQASRIRQEAAHNVQVRDYLLAVLRQSDPLFSGAPSSVDAAIEQSLTQARTQLASQPDLLAEVLRVSAEGVMRRGDFARSAELIGEAVSLRRVFDANDPRLPDILMRYGQALHYMARYPEAQAALREAQSRAKAARQTDGGRFAAGIAMALADVLHSRGDYAQAKDVLLSALDLQPPEFARVELRRDLGVVMRDAGELAAALSMLQTSVDALARLPNVRVNLANAQAALARGYALAGMAAQAHAYADQAFQTMREIYGEHHPVLGISRHTLALAMAVEQRWAEAEDLLDVVLNQDYLKVAKGNVLPAYAHLDRAWVRLARQDAGAVADLDAAESVFVEIRAGGHPRLAELLCARAVLANQNAQPQQPAKLLAKALALREAQFGAAHPLTQQIRAWQAKLEGKSVPPESSLDESSLDAQRRSLLSPLKR